MNKYKKILTLDDLFNFCKTNKTFAFDAKETGYQLAVRIPAEFSREDSKDDKSMLYAKIKAFHTGRNRNGSDVTMEAAKKAMKKMAYKPLLANFTDDNSDFTAHDMIIDDDGEITYLEKQVGCFTADEPELVQDEKKPDKYFVVAMAAIPREYTAAAEIIERKNGTKVSVELLVNQCGYDSENDVLALTDVEVYGCTLLGVDPDTGKAVAEGMEGARLDIADFSADNGIRFTENEDIKKFIKESIIEAFDNIKNSKEGGKTVNEENLTMTESQEENPTEEAACAVSEENGKTPSEETPTEAFEAEGTDTEAEKEAESEDEPTEETEAPITNAIQYTVKLGENMKEFAAKSLTDIIYGLTDLVNTTYAEDGTFYWVDVFDGGTAKTRYVIMQDVYTGVAYRQAFTVKDEVYTLKGNRVQVHSVWMTDEEEADFEKIRSNYAANEEKLSKYEAEPAKMEILNSADYAKISESEEFTALKEMEAHFDLSVDEVRAKADALLLNAAKAGTLEFAAAEPAKKDIPMKKLPAENKPKSIGRYGNMFSK